MVKKILAVDNDEDILISIEDMFRELGSFDYQVASTDSGKEAIEIIERENPDLVITAIDIDSIDGLDIIKKSKQKKIKTIVLTSRVDEETVEMIKAYYKPDSYIKKPLEKPELLREIKNIFSRKERIIENLSAEKARFILQKICDSIEQGIAIIDKEFNIISVNKALEKKGFLFENVVGHKSYEIFDNRSSPEENSPTLKALHTGEISILEKTGSDKKMYKMTSIPVKNKSGEVENIIELGEEIKK